MVAYGYRNERCLLVLYFINLKVFIFQLIDLHIFVVPIQSWLGKYSVAYNNVALQSTSAGFVR